MISAVVLTKNEQETIKDCIKSIFWCDEIILIDDYSEDTTVELAKECIQSLREKKLSIQVYKRHLKGNFSQQRNFGLKYARFEWVLFLDADERISEKLKEEILLELNDSENTIQGFYFPREDYFRGKKLRYGETASVSFLRLGRRKKGRWNRNVHEKWEIKGNTALLKHPILHFPHPSIKIFLQDINWYTDLICTEWEKSGKKVRWVGLFIYPVAKFLYNYLLLLGFLDGNAGIIMATMMSFHSFLVRGKYLTRKKSQYV